MLDAIAREAGIEPHEVRMKNLIRPEQMPFDNITNKHFDSGDYPQSLQRALAAVDLAAIRARQQRGEPDGRLIGVGLAIYCEQAAHGTSVYAGWGIPMVPGHEQASARLTPDGGLELRVGVQSHGQSLETTLAQVAHEILGIDVEKITVVHGDTQYTPYSTGTWGSRCMVMAGGAVAAASKEIARRAAKIGARLLQADAADVVIRDGRAIGPNGSVSIAEIARTWYLKPQDLPSDVDPGGLDVTAGYKPQRNSGTFSYATHVAVVAVDSEIGDVEILDYVIVEDGGKLVNPMVVDGQICGGLAQGIGTALYEEMPFDGSGQPLASTFAEYLLPGSTEVPAPRIDHMETLSPYTEFGVKGIGEGGAIAPPAAIANAVNDALKSLNAEVLQSPITPRRVLEAIAAARRAAENPESDASRSIGRRHSLGTRSSAANSGPDLVRIECRHARCDLRCRTPEVLLEDDALMVHDEGHDARIAVLGRISDETEATDHLAAHHIIECAAGSLRPLSLQDLVVVAVIGVAGLRRPDSPRRKLRPRVRRAGFAPPLPVPANTGRLSCRHC